MDCISLFKDLDINKYDGTFDNDKNNNYSLNSVLDPNLNFNIGYAPQYESLYSVKNADIWDDRLMCSKSIYRCLLCQSIYNNSASRKQHFEITHFVEYCHKCEFCCIMFLSKTECKVHMAAHRHTFEFTCDACDDFFRTIEELNHHSTVHLRDKLYNCLFCSETFNNEQALEVHLNTHTSINLQESNVTDIEIIKPISVQIHTNKFVTGCPACGEMFSKVKDRNKHMRLHMVKNRHECPLCGKSFNHIGSVKRHLKTHCSEPKFQCAICDKSYKKANTLQEHMKVHCRETLYKCNVCDKFNQNLTCHKRHMNSHEKEFDL